MKPFNQILGLTKKALNTAVLAALPVIAATTPSNAASPATPYFQRIATYLVCENTSCDRDSVKETVAEIIAVNKDGNILIYTDSPTGKIGFVNISEPANPTGLGTVDTSGEPTSVTVSGDYVLVGVNTSSSFVTPSGMLSVYHLPSCLVDVANCAPVRNIDMGGQPDSVAVSLNGRYAAVVIENERDETVTVAGVKGGLPQSPPGT